MADAKRIFDSFLHLDERGDSTVSQLLFFIPFVIWMIARTVLFRSTMASLLGGNSYYHSIWIFCLGCLVLRELLFGKWDRLAFLGLCTFAFMMSMAAMAKYTAVIETICFVAAGRNVQFKRLVLVSTATLGATCLLVIISAKTGLIVDAIYAIREGAPRYQLGFAHPNTGPGILFFVACGWTYLRKEKYGILDCVVICFLTAVLYYFTRARASCAATVCIGLIALLVKRIPKRALKNRAVSFFAVGSVALCAVISIAFTILYDPSISWMASLDHALSGRLQLGHNAIVKYGFPLLGQRVDSGLTMSFDLMTGQWVKSSRETATIIDCEYVKFLVMCGWPFLLVGLAMCTCVNYRALRFGDTMLLIVIAIIALHGIAETYGPYAFWNPFAFLLGSLFGTGYMLNGSENERPS